MAQLRPMMAIVDVRKTPDEILQERFAVFVPALGELMKAVDHNSPFYPEEIFAVLDELINIGIEERDDIKLSDDRIGLKGRRRGKHNFDKFRERAQKLSALIRERLAKLSVYDGN